MPESEIGAHWKSTLSRRTQTIAVICHTYTNCTIISFGATVTARGGRPRSLAAGGGARKVGFWNVRRDHLLFKKKKNIAPRRAEEDARRRTGIGSSTTPEEKNKKKNFLLLLWSLLCSPTAGTESVCALVAFRASRAATGQQHATCGTTDFKIDDGDYFSVHDVFARVSIWVVFVVSLHSSVECGSFYVVTASLCRIVLGKRIERSKTMRKTRTRGRLTSFVGGGGVLVLGRSPAANRSCILFDADQG